MKARSDACWQVVIKSKWDSNVTVCQSNPILSSDPHIDRGVIVAVPQLAVSQLGHPLKGTEIGSVLYLSIDATVGVRITRSNLHSHGSATVCFRRHIRCACPRCISQASSYHLSQLYADRRVCSIHTLREHCILQSLNDNKLDVWRCVARHTPVYAQGTDC